MELLQTKLGPVELPPTSDTSLKSQVINQVPMTTSWVWEFARMALELGETSYIYRDWWISRWRGSEGEVPKCAERRCFCSQGIGMCHLPGLWMCSSAHKLFRWFSQQFHHRLDQLLTQPPASSAAEAEKRAWKFQASTQGLVFLVTSPPSWGCPRAHQESPY